VPYEEEFPEGAPTKALREFTVPLESSQFVSFQIQKAFDQISAFNTVALGQTISRQPFYGQEKRR
jgi:hypothetical protein